MYDLVLSKHLLYKNGMLCLPIPIHRSKFSEQQIIGRYYPLIIPISNLNLIIFKFQFQIKQWIGRVSLELRITSLKELN